jgi:hypothetical protein
MRKALEGKKKRKFFKRVRLEHTLNESNDKNVNVKGKEMNFMSGNEKLFFGMINFFCFNSLLLFEFFQIYFPTSSAEYP